MTTKSFFLTTAIDYANGNPHLGHAFEKIGADAIARYHRLSGDDVFFLMGMDEHGQKVAQTAAAANVQPQDLVDRVAGIFAKTWQMFGTSNDRFIRTTDPAHKAGVRALIERIFERNPDDFYEKAYEGWYCVGCEVFKRDNEIENGRCVLHPTRDLEWTAERNWFFRLSRYEGFLRSHFEEHPDFLQPATRRNEILALLDAGLEDISVSRARLAWAIPFPRPTSDGEAQGTWVWFDALPNYLTATGFPQPGYDEVWPADLHVIGKDITRQHTVVWPAMLKSAELALPRRVWAHGFVSVGGERFSKSAGVSVDLDELVGRYGADALRYFLLREVPWDSDGNFTLERFDERFTADLANDLGNLANRTLSMVHRYRAGRVPAGPATELDERASEVVRAYNDRMSRYLLHEGAATAFRLVSEANAFIEAQAPWKLAKDPSGAERLDSTLRSLVRALAIAATLLEPFMPVKMRQLWVALGRDGGPPRIHELEGLEPTGWEVASRAVLFPRPELEVSAQAK